MNTYIICNNGISTILNNKFIYLVENYDKVVTNNKIYVSTNNNIISIILTSIQLYIMDKQKFINYINNVDDIYMYDVIIASDYLGVSFIIDHYNKHIRNILKL